VSGPKTINIKQYLNTNNFSSNLHKQHNFEPVEKILSEKLDDLKGAEARYSKDLT
jgi:hypothetical protein